MGGYSHTVRHTLHHFLLLWPWVTCFSSPSLNLLMCNYRVVPTSRESAEGSVMECMLRTSQVLETVHTQLGDDHLDALAVAALPFIPSSHLLPAGQQKCPFAGAGVCSGL